MKPLPVQLLLSYLTIRNALVDPDNELKEIAETTDQLLQGYGAIELFNDHYRDLVLVIGNKRTGKSTLALFAGGQLNDLNAVDNDNIDDFLIESRSHDWINNEPEDEGDTAFYPNIVVDEDGVAFYDCIALNSITMKYEIASKFFLKRTVDHARSLKFVLVADYESVADVDSTNDFNELMKNVHLFMKRISKYKDSISLVVTKVEPDELSGNVIEKIAGFLRTYRDELDSESPSEFDEFATILVDILLAKKNDGHRYEKIAIFRKPNDSGPLSNIKYMVEDRKKIREMIINGTKYEKKTRDDDFAFNITRSSNSQLLSLVDKINSKIRDIVHEIGDVIESELQIEVQNLGNLKRMASRFEDVHSRITGFKTDDKMNADTIVNAMTDVAIKIEVKISLELFDSIQQLESYITFMQYFTIGSKINPTEWMDGLKDCLSYLDRSKNWFKFLSDIYERYSEYDFRVNFSQYTPESHITQGNFWHFVSKQTFTTLPFYDKFPTQSELQLLNDLLHVTVNGTMKTVCDKPNDKLIVKGHYVRLGEVETIDCGFNIKVLLIFASHTVFIDTNSTKTYDMLIVAPKWHVVGTKLIHLYGSNSKEIQQNQANDGQNGQPGLSGEPGPSFAGYGKDFINHLTVESVGGNGGAGQDGGKGASSTDPPVDSLHQSYRTISCSEAIHESHYLESHMQYVSSNCDDNDYSISFLSSSCVTWYDFYGTCGQSGGAGGQGGKGGTPGNIKMFQLARKSNAAHGITPILRAGVDGNDGQDGNGGATSTIIRMQCIEADKWTLFDEQTTKWRRESSRVGTHCSAESSRPKNANGLTMPAKPRGFDSTFHLSDYLSFMRESQIQQLKRDDVLSFVKAIGKDENVANSYTIRALMNEYLVLESQYFRLNDKIDLEIYYHSFATKIETMMTKYNPIYRVALKIMNYLYAAAWGRYVAMKSQPLLIIDVQSYLDLTIDIIEKVDKSKRKQIIDDHRKQHKDHIMSKVESVNGLLNNEILPLIEDIKRDLNSNLNQLLAETVAMEKVIVSETSEYQEQLDKVRFQMGSHIFFGVLQVVGTFVSALGPYGMATGAIVQSVSSIGNSLTGKLSPPQNPVKIPDGVRSALESVKDIVDSRRDLQIVTLNQQVDKIYKTLSEFGDEDSKQQMDQIVNKLERRSGFGDIGLVQQSVKKLMDQSQSIMKPNHHVLDALKGINDALKVAQASINVYQQYEADANQLAVIGQALEQSQNNLKQLLEFERRIFSDIGPMVTEMLANIDKIEATPSNSRISIEWKKYRIQSWLRETKVQMHKFTKGFAAEEDILRTIQNLDDIYLTLINIYDHVEVYNDQARFADFMADIMTSDVESIQVADPKLNADMNRLDMIINSNVLLKHYKLAVDAFRHKVFPFANNYLRYYKLPTYLQADDFPTLVTQASNHVKDLQAKYREYNAASINENDEYIVKATFTNSIDQDTSLPFYEWHFKNHGKMITNFLSGKMVQVRANIERGLSLNAVKFSLIRLAIDNSNPSQQSQLEKKLLQFDVTMKHMGNSYYRCGTSYYMIHSPATVIMYSNQQMYGEPLRYNNVYTKLLRGDILLSPYALWTIQLEYVGRGRASTKFEELKSLAAGTNLYLVGKGFYVKNNVPICRTKPSDYKDFEIFF